LPKFLFSGPETLFDKSKALVPGNLKNALWAQITSHAGLRRDLCAENVSMRLKKIFVWATTLCFGTSQWLLYANISLASVIKSL
jgi:hypothetical protein